MIITTMSMVMVMTIMGISMRRMATIMAITLIRILIRRIMDKITGTVTTTHIPIRMAIMGTITTMATITPTLIPTPRGNSSPTRRSTATTNFSDWR